MFDLLLPALEQLSKKYNFRLKDALVHIGHQPEKFIIPYVGEVYEGCKAVKWSYGLHTQCQNTCDKNERYCPKCCIYRDKNKLIGDICERTNIGLLDYVDNKGRRTIPWINYIKDKKINKERCLAFLKERNINIPQAHLIECRRGRGRPKRKEKKEIIIQKPDYLTFLEKELFAHEEDLELHKIEDTNFGVDEIGNIYKLCESGAVKMPHNFSLNYI